MKVVALTPLEVVGTGEGPPTPFLWHALLPQDLATPSPFPSQTRPNHLLYRASIQVIALMVFPDLEPPRPAFQGGPRSPAPSLASIPDVEPPDQNDSDSSAQSHGSGVNRHTRKNRRLSGLDHLSPTVPRHPRPRSGLFYLDSPLKETFEGPNRTKRMSLNYTPLSTPPPGWRHSVQDPELPTLVQTLMEPAPINGTLGREVGDDVSVGDWDDEPLPNPHASPMTHAREPATRARSSRGSSPVRACPAHISREASPVRARASRQPFNFKSQIMLHSNSSANSLNGHPQSPSSSSSKPAHRKGHRYKHSSVSMNLFQEPDRSVELKIPTALAFPTLPEIRHSLTRVQLTKVAWGCWHATLSALLYTASRTTGLPNFDTLAHLVFYDAVALLTVIAVDIMGNFDCWSTSLIRYPFGLGRLHVLAGFALSIWLSFVGFDLSNHCLEEYMATFVEGEQDHRGGHHHNHTDMTLVEVVLANPKLFLVLLLCTMITTVVSARLLLDDSSSKSLMAVLKMNVGGSPLQLWRRFTQKVNNPAHLLTLLLTLLLLVAHNPYYPLPFNERIMTFAIAILIVVLGIKLTHKLGQILILSFPSSKRVFDKLHHCLETDIRSLDSFTSLVVLEDLFITKFNYNLYVVGVKMKMVGGSDQEESLLRKDTALLIKRGLQRFEESISGWEKEGRESGPDARVEPETYEITVDIDRL